MMRRVVLILPGKEERMMRRVVPLLPKKQGVMRRREVSFLLRSMSVMMRRVVSFLFPSLGETGSNEAQRGVLFSLLKMRMLCKVVSLSPRSLGESPLSSVPLGAPLRVIKLINVSVILPFWAERGGSSPLGLSLILPKNGEAGVRTMRIVENS